VEFVALESQAGSDCRLRNPWGEGAIDLYRDDVKAETLTGLLPVITTRKGERIVIVTSGTAPERLKRAIPGG